MNPPMTVEERRKSDAVARLERERADLLHRAPWPDESVAGMTHAEKAVRLARAAASLRREI